MKTKYLLHFAHEHISFRWTEFLALTFKNNCKFRLVSEPEHIKTRPFIIIELEDGTSTRSIIESARGSYLMKGLFELWAESKISIDDLSREAGRSSQCRSRLFSGAEHSFRINCESFGSKLKQQMKVDWIRRMTFLEDFDARPNLANPKQTYCIFEMNEKLPDNTIVSKEYYFGRHLTSGDRAAINQFSLKTRTFIANTSMDPMLSLIAANAAMVKTNDIVYDPFVGSGSLLVAAAYKGAVTIGSDIDWQLLHGKSRPSRKGETKRQVGESVRSNLEQYGLQDRYLDVMISDITRSPLREGFKIDSIISDPPYGIRECSEKIGVRKERKSLKEHQVRYPSKTCYTMKELLRDLLTLSAKHLTLGGRLIYYLPVTKSDCDLNDFIPHHPSLSLISYCEQDLTAKVSRLMVVMEKVQEPQEGDEVDVPEIINDMNFRETYFSKST